MDIFSYLWCSQVRVSITLHVKSIRLLWYTP